MNDTDTKISTNVSSVLKTLYGVFTAFTGAALFISSTFSIKALLLRQQPLKSRLNAFTAMLGGLLGAELLGGVILDGLEKSPNEKKDKEDTGLLQKIYMTITLATGWTFAVASAGWLFLKGTAGKEPEKLTAKPVAVSAGLLGAELLSGWISHKIAHKHKSSNSFTNRLKQEKLKTPETSASR